MSYQRAIEDVYWHHRIWPKERPDPKPSLDAVMSQAQLEKKVADYLRNSQALEDYWQRPITAKQLQAEMDRMATHTKQPEVLQELFEALGNDPFVIAECLARPALAERLLTNWYAYDLRIHGELKQRAETELRSIASVGQMKQLSGKYSEIEFLKSDAGQQKNNGAVGHSVRLSSREWDETIQKLVAGFDSTGSNRVNARRCSHGAASPWGRGQQNQRASTQRGDYNGSPHTTNGGAEEYKPISIGKLSSLQEDENRYYSTMVVEETKDHLKLGTVSWLKEPFESWIAKAESRASTAMAAPRGNYTLSKISGGGCIEDTWTPTAGAPSPRGYHTAIWTGSEMIVWGGRGDSTGGRYNPATDSWTPTSVTNAPEARTQHTAVWTGSEMIIWGGSGFVDLNTGGRYDPTTDSWATMSTINAPEGRYAHTAVWSDSEMIVWGGGSNGNNFNTGGRYNPNTDSWTATTTANAPSARSAHTAVWTGTEMIIWGGYSGGFSNTGGRYNPVTDSWTSTATANAPSARQSHTAVWTNSDMVVWGGYDDTLANTGGRYNPATNSWTVTDTTNAPPGRWHHTAVWTGTEMIVWGGDSNGGLNTGGRYNPDTNTWMATNIIDAPDGRNAHTAVWTGNEMIVWGGYIINPTDTGGRYDPNADSWLPTAVAPSPRYSHTAIWTGTEMIVWGGYFDLNSGGRYNLALDNWATTSTNNAPSGRFAHTAVWSGSEMIVWGGTDQFDYLNSGGRYDPMSNSWTATNMTNAPSGRDGHTAIWAGDEMIVWGGYFFDNGDHYLNTGGRYRPITDSWITTTTTNAPSVRNLHTAVWTGSEMLIWGGHFFDDNDHYLNTGGRYNPGTDSWLATGITNAPQGRDFHTAVWTGSMMIIWGGREEQSPFPVNTGGKYNPDTDSWIPTSTTNAPDGRYSHTAVWTDNEMIVWGGTDFFDGLNTGGRYNPITDDWFSTTTTNAPSGREAHKAVSTGNEMIVWGGSNPDPNIGTLNTGGRYCAVSGPTPTPSPTPTPTATPRVTPRPRPTPRHRPTPP